MPDKSSRTLSKSDFSLARTCDAKLWFRENGYQDNRELDDYVQLLAVGGYMVEALATAQRPDGIKLEYGGTQLAPRCIPAGRPLRRPAESWLG